MKRWEEEGNAGWRYWLSYEDAVLSKTAKVLDVSEEEVGLAASQTIALHSLLSSFYKPKKDGPNYRRKILMLTSEFPSDIFAVESWIELYEGSSEDLVLAEGNDIDGDITSDNIVELIEQHREELYIVVISLVSSYFGHYYDIPKVSEACRKYGVILILDLAHCVASVPI